MKRGLVAAAVFLVLVFVGQVFARASQPEEWSAIKFRNELAKAKVEKFTGTVLSHDPACHCVVVRTAKGNLTLQDDYGKFMAKYDRAKGLIIGSEVKGAYKTVNYIHYLMNIEYVNVPTTAFIPASLKGSI